MGDGWEEDSTVEEFGTFSENLVEEDEAVRGEEQRRVK